MDSFAPSPSVLYHSSNFASLVFNELRAIRGNSWRGRTTARAFSGSFFLLFTKSTTRWLLPGRGEGGISPVPFLALDSIVGGAIVRFVDHGAPLRQDEVGWDSFNPVQSWAFAGNHLQNGHDFIRPGMSGLEISFGRRA